jgi:hypothetical protein
MKIAGSAAVVPTGGVSVLVLIGADWRQNRPHRRQNVVRLVNIAQTPAGYRSNLRSLQLKSRAAMRRQRQSESVWQH